MTQEPRSFFERLTGAKVLRSPGDSEDQEIPVHDTQRQNTDFLPREVETVLSEPETEDEEEYTDETALSSDEEQEGQLTVDVFQDDTSIIIQSTVAGVSPDDLDVSITNDMVTIRGERKRVYDVSEQDYFYQECYWGTFSRSVILPVEIDADNAEAKMKNGVLTIRIPKANIAVTRKLKVKDA
ncbi:MAG TPA: Hsp20/alpha crystallin family protein [Candidatus Andersenbacteria bacterium]|nr:Hsp20/alpha crystallin family protein [Candidatus Andersenbacteria bacterium]